MRTAAWNKRPKGDLMLSLMHSSVVILSKMFSVHILSSTLFGWSEAAHATSALSRVSAAVHVPASAPRRRTG